MSHFNRSKPTIDPRGLDNPTRVSKPKTKSKAPQSKGGKAKASAVSKVMAESSAKTQFGRIVGEEYDEGRDARADADERGSPGPEGGGEAEAKVLVRKVEWYWVKKPHLLIEEKYSSRTDQDIVKSGSGCKGVKRNVEAWPVGILKAERTWAVEAGGGVEKLDAEGMMKYIVEAVEERLKAGGVMGTDMEGLLEQDVRKAQRVFEARERNQGKGKGKA